MTRVTRIKAVMTPFPHWIDADEPLVPDAPAGMELRIVDRLADETIDFLADGGRVLLVSRSDAEAEPFRAALGELGYLWIRVGTRDGVARLALTTNSE